MNWNRWPVFCGALACLFLLRGLLYFCFAPPLEGFDEMAHIARLVYEIEEGPAPTRDSAA